VGLILKKVVSVKKLKVKQCLIQDLKIHLNSPSHSKNNYITKLLKKWSQKARVKLSYPGPSYPDPPKSKVKVGYSRPQTVSHAWHKKVTAWECTVSNLFVFGANLNAKNEHNDKIFYTTTKRHFEIYSFKGLKLTWQKSSDFREFLLLSQFKPPKTIKYLNNNVCIVNSRNCI
jgi:hypothetical protein